MFWRKKQVVSEEVAKLIAKINSDPLEWSADYYTLTHTPSDVQIWVADGADYVSFWQPQKIKLRPVDQKAIWRAYEGWRYFYKHTGVRDLVKFKRTFLAGCSLIGRLYSVEDVRFSPDAEYLVADADELLSELGRKEG